MGINCMQFGSWFSQNHQAAKKKLIDCIEKGIEALAGRYALEIDT